MTNIYESGTLNGSQSTGLGSFFLASVATMAGALLGGAASAGWSSIPVGVEEAKSASDAAEYKEKFRRLSGEYDLVSRRQYIPGAGISRDDLAKVYKEYQEKEEALALEAFVDRDLNESDTRNLLMGYADPLYSLPKFLPTEVEECRVSVGDLGAMKIEEQAIKIAACSLERGDTSAKVAVFGGGALGLFGALAYPFFVAGGRRKKNETPETTAPNAVTAPLPKLSPPKKPAFSIE